ncbi:MAG: carbohydrate kinase family protein [Rhizobiaceae bacterium]
MSAPSILVLGNANVDLVLGEVDGWPAVGTEVVVERSEMRAGGSAGNTALALSGLGVPHLFVASTGNDPNGAWLRERFDPACCDWIVDDCDTTVTVGIVHKGGDRAFFTTPGHLQRARLDDLLARIPRATESGVFAIVSGGFLMPEIEADTLRLLETLRDRGWRTAIDPGWPPQGWSGDARKAFAAWLHVADMTLINEEEAAGASGGMAAEDAAAFLASGLSGDRALVIKRGGQGVSCHGAGETLHVTAPSVRVIDTVGAGDTFNAGLLSALARGAGLEEALRLGVSVAAHAISTFPRRYA